MHFRNPQKRASSPEKNDQEERHAQSSEDKISFAPDGTPHITPQNIIHLQRVIGNSAVQRLLDNTIQRNPTSVTEVTVEEPAVTDRMEVGFQATYNDGSIGNFRLNVSHKKHLLDSYFSGESGNVPSAATNTVVNTSTEDFKKAFQDYARFLGAEHKKVFPADVDPSDPGNEYPSRMGITFHADRNRLSTNIHSFPTDSGDNAVSLDKNTHARLKKVLNYLYQGDSKPETAQGVLRDWNLIKGTAEIVKLISELKRVQITARLKSLASVKDEHRALSSHRARLENDSNYVPKEDK